MDKKKKKALVIIGYIDYSNLNICTSLHPPEYVSCHSKPLYLFLCETKAILKTYFVWGQHYSFTLCARFMLLYNIATYSQQRYMIRWVQYEKA